MSIAAFRRGTEPRLAESIFTEMDRLIAESQPQERPALVVQLAARLAVLGAGWPVPVNAREDTPAVQEPAMVTYQDAAKFLSCSVSYVETMVRQGKLPHVKLPAADKAGRFRDGRLVRLLLSDLRAFVEANRS